MADEKADNTSLSACEAKQADGIVSDKPTMSDSEIKKRSRKYHWPFLEPMEYLELYQPGGLHPVHLGDRFDNGRYKVIHKLGAGGCSTVWLARDEQYQRYVALKIIGAWLSNDCIELKVLQYLMERRSDHPGREHIAFPLDHFRLDGPNGSHICLVFPFLGPDLSAQGRIRLKGKLARSAARRSAQTLAYLHSEGICHGDFKNSNILFQFINLDSLSEDELLLRLGAPETEPCRTLSGDPPGPSAPDYLVETVDFFKVWDTWLTEGIRIIDFGVSFFINNPPNCRVGTTNYMAPEILFEERTSVYSDVWALGCTIYELRAGRSLFELLMSTHPAQVVYQMMDKLGGLPEAWNDLYFDERGRVKPVKDTEEDFEGWIKRDDDWRQSLSEAVSSMEAEPPEDCNLGAMGPNGDKVCIIPREEHLISRKFGAPRKYCKGHSKFFWRPPPSPMIMWNKVERIKEVDGELTTVIEEERLEEPEIPYPRISLKEAASLYDLLNKILKYDAEQRISAEAVANHPWCTGAFETEEVQPTEKVMVDGEIELLKDDKEGLGDLEEGSKQLVGDKRKRIMDDRKDAAQTVVEKKMRVINHEEGGKEPLVDGQKDTAEDGKVKMKPVHADTNDAGSQYVMDGTQPVTEPETPIGKHERVRKPSVLASIGRALVFGAVIGVIWHFATRRQAR